MSAARYPSADELLDQAVAESGLSEFGPGDFRQGLRVLLGSLECDGDLHPDADHAVLGDFRRRLVNRLEVEAWYETHPEVENVAIRGPVDINGLPRTGTTALADMLSLDPQFRCLRGWEQTKPVPPPVLADEANDPRRRSFEELHESRSKEQRAMHIFEVDAAMEDTEILGHGLPRTADDAAGVVLPGLVARGGPHPDLRVPSACRQAPRFEEAPRSVAVQGSPPQIPPGGTRLRLPRCPVRHDASRPRQGGALLREPRALDHTARQGGA